jgi:hypothetical protein
MGSVYFLVKDKYMKILIAMGFQRGNRRNKKEPY